jgi:hypothetical protein
MLVAPPEAVVPPLPVLPPEPIAPPEPVFPPTLLLPPEAVFPPALLFALVPPLPETSPPLELHATAVKVRYTGNCASAA